MRKNHMISESVSDHIAAETRTARMLLLLVGCALSGCTLLAAQSTHLVPTTYPTIQAAIAAAAPGDTVRVLPGTYFEHDISFLGKRITVESTGGALATIINANYAGRVFALTNSEPTGTMLRGFAIVNGYPGDIAGGHGGGILCIGASLTIADCIFTNCFASHAPPAANGNLGGSGGAIAAFGGDLHIERCLIQNSHAGRGGDVFNAPFQCIPGGWGGAGGGIVRANGPLTILDTVIKNCTAGPGSTIDDGISACRGGSVGAGGGIAATSSLITIERSEIVDCRSGRAGAATDRGGNGGDGGGIAVFSCIMRLTDSSLTSNHAPSGANGDLQGSDGRGGGLFAKTSFVELERSRVVGNFLEPPFLGFGWPAPAAGGAGLYSEDSTVRLRSTVVAENHIQPLTMLPIFGQIPPPGSGGGLFADGGSVEISHTTFTGNRAGFTNVSGTGGAIRATSSTMVDIRSSILWNDFPDEVASTGPITVSHSDIAGGFTGPGNILSDPLIRCLAQ